MGKLYHPQVAVKSGIWHAKTSSTRLNAVLVGANLSYLSEAAPLYFQRFYTGLITNRSQLVTPIRLMGRRVISLLDALIAGQDMEVTTKLTLARRPGYLPYFTGQMNGTLMNVYNWRTASFGVVQIFDTSVDVEYIAPGSTTPTVIFTKPSGSIAKSYFFGVGNYLYVSGDGYQFKWDGPFGSQGTTNWGISISALSTATGPNAPGTAADVNVNSNPWANPNNIKANDGAFSTISLVAGTNITSPATLPKSGKTSGLGPFPWTNPANITLADSVGATVSLGSDGNDSQFLYGEGYGFAIPASATILGITLQINRKAQSGTINDEAVFLTKDGFNHVGTTHTAVANWPASYGVQSYGGATDLWGTTWTPAQINSANFGAMLSVQGGFGPSNVANVDYFKIIINYKTAGGVAVSDYLQATNFGFGGFSAVQVVGIKVEVKGLQTQTPNTTLSATMLKNGALIGTTKTGIRLPSTNGFITYGGASDLWGGTWTQNDINQTTFGVSLQASNPSSTNTIWSVDFVRITVYGLGGPTIAVAAGAGATSAVNGWSYVVAYGNSVSGEISNASPPSNNTGVFTNKAGVNITLVASTDPQVNQIHVYRTTDSGGGSIFYELPNSPAPNANGTLVDTSPDTGLQVSQIAATTLQNTPPPSGILSMEWFAGRMWGAVNSTAGALLYASTGPDTLVGNAQSNWNPSYVWVLPTQIVRLLSTPNGLIVHCVDDSYIVRGTATVNFTVNEFSRDIAVRNYNAVDSDGSNIYVFSSERQLLQISGAGINEVGHEIADQLVNVDPTQVYVSVYRNGQDSMLFVLDSVNDIIYPYNVNQQCWCLPAVLQFTGNVTAAGTVESSPGNWAYLVGAGTSLGQRDLATFADLGNLYSPSVVIGTLQLADPLSLAKIENIILQLTNAGTTPTVSVLANDEGVILENPVGSQITGNFTSMSVAGNPIIEPPTYAAQPTAFMNLRYQWALIGVPEQLQYLQILLQFTAEAFKNEVIGMGLSGKNSGESPGQSALPALMGH